MTIANIVKSLNDGVEAIQRQNYGKAEECLKLFEEGLEAILQPARNDLYEGERLLKACLPKFNLESLTSREQVRLYASVNELAKEVLFPPDFIEMSEEQLAYHKNQIERGEGGFLSKYILYRRNQWKSTVWEPLPGENRASVTWLKRHLEQFVQHPTEDGYSSLVTFHVGLWNCPLYETFDKIDQLLYLSAVQAAETAWMADNKDLSRKILSFFNPPPYLVRVDRAFNFIVTRPLVGDAKKVQFEWEVCLLNRSFLTQGRVDALVLHYARLKDFQSSEHIDWEIGVLEKLWSENEKVS